MKNGYDVAAFYFPQWHPDPQNEGKHFKGWSEWHDLKLAKPRFPGHAQPKTPLWGELDESDPRVSEKQIDAAADHGITVFLYDWYWDLGPKAEGPFLQRALEEGFLKAKNRDCLKFALMWANHNQVSRARFDAMADYIIQKYCRFQNHWKLDGKLFFSIYEMHTLMQGLGGLEETRDALEGFRAKLAKAKLPDLHLNAIEWGIQARNLGIFGKTPKELTEYLGVNSVTSYVWMHNIHMEHFPDEPYGTVAPKAAASWRAFQEQFSVPYFPNVTQGWDPSPRSDQGKEYVRADYPYMPVLTQNTPAAFEKSLRDAKNFVDGNSGRPKIVTLYAWNEWTEGGYLEPDTVNGMGYLQAIKKVFGA